MCDNNLNMERKLEITEFGEIYIYKSSAWKILQYIDRFFLENSIGSKFKK